MAEALPSHLYSDRYWGPLLYLFTENDKLNQMFTTKYFDIQNCHVKVRSLKMASRGWSRSEKFMLDLALHCYNDSNKVNFGDMDYLDYNNKELAFEALKMRYGS